MRLRLLSIALLVLLSFVFSPKAHAAVDGHTQTCPVQPAAAVTAADTAYAAGNMAEGETLATAQVGTTPTLASYAVLVRVQLERNELKAAAETAKSALAAYPTSALAQSLVGDAELRGGNIPAASAAYVAALKLDACSARALLGHGRVNNMVGRHTLGGQELNNAHTLAPRDAEITMYWVETRTPAERGSALRALLDSSPVLPPTMVQRASDELRVIEQQLLCTPSEAVATMQMELAPLIYSGTTARSFGLQVRVNSKITALMELDSSVDGIVLNPHDADRAGVRALSATSETKPWMGVAEHLRIGKIDYQNCPVQVVPAAALNNSNSLIGTNFFRDHLIRIDYAAQTLTLRPLPAITPGSPEPFISAEEKDWTPAYVVGANVLIPTMLGPKGPFPFLLATGSRNNVFSPEVLTDTLGKHRETSRNLKGSSGEIIKVFGRVDDPDPNFTAVRGPDGKILDAYTPIHTPLLRFGNYARSDIYAISFDISPKSHAVGVEVSGLIGFHILSDFFCDINYRDSRVRLQLDENHRYAEREERKLH